MGYSFIISTSIKQVKVLELILSLQLEAVAVNPHHVVKFLHASETSKSKLAHQRDSRNIRSGQINSLVHFETKRMHCWAQQHKNACMSTEDNSGGWSEGPLRGKEKPFHNIQPREEHSPGGRHGTAKVYNQEKTSQEQVQWVYHNVQTRPH